MDEAIQYFEDKRHAQAYARHRPVVPDTVLQTIKAFIQDGGCQCDTAVDVGCGTGHQSTLPLSRFFNNVIGVDISQEQINQAPKNLPNVTFRVGRAEDLSFLQDASVDFVCASSSVHWLDLAVFYEDVKRVLKPGGCLAVFWFGVPIFDNKEANEAFWKYFGSCEFLHKGVKRIWIRNEKPPCPSGQWTENITESSTSMTISDHISEEATTSFNQLTLKKYSQNKLLQTYQQRLLEIYDKGQGEETVLRVTLEETLLLWRKEAH